MHSLKERLALLVLSFLSSTILYEQTQPSAFSVPTQFFGEFQRLFVFADFRESPFNVHVNMSGVLRDSGVSVRGTSVVGNGTDRIYNKQAKVPAPSHVQLQRVGDHFQGKTALRRLQTSGGTKQAEQLQRAGVRPLPETLSAPHTN